MVGLEEAGVFGGLGLIAFGVNDVILYAKDGDAIMLTFLRHLAVHSRCFVFIFSWYSGLLFFSVLFLACMLCFLLHFSFLLELAH